MEPSVVLTGTTMRAAPPREGVGLSRMLPAAAAVAVAAAADRGTGRRRAASKVSRCRARSRLSTRERPSARARPPLLPPRATSLVPMSPTTHARVLVPLPLPQMLLTRRRAASTRRTLSAQLSPFEAENGHWPRDASVARVW